MAPINNFPPPTGSLSEAASGHFTKPAVVLAASVVLLVLLIRRRIALTRVQHQSALSEGAMTDDEKSLSDLPPPLRSIYRHHSDHTKHTRTSSSLAAEAAALRRQEEQLSRTTPPPPPPPPPRRHSYPSSTAGSKQRSGTPIESSSVSSELIHDKVQFFPALDDKGREMSERYWRRRTMVFG
jgi:hypothetical protein